MTRSSKEDPSITLWKIHWESVQIELEGSDAVGGTMKVVGGSLFSKGKDVSEFTADGAVADKESNSLKLWGKVVVRSKEHGITLTCDKLTWHADRGVLEPTGTVTIQAEGYKMGPFDRLLCSPELQYVSTPDLFKEPK